MLTLSADEFKKKYGVIAASQFDQADKKKEQETSLFDSLKSQIGDAFQGGINQAAQGFNDAATGVSPLQQVEAGAKVGAGVTNAVMSPFAPIGNAVNKYLVKPVSNFIGGSKTVQDFANSPAGETTSRVAEDVGNLATIAGGAATAAGVKASFTAPDKALYDQTLNRLKSSESFDVQNSIKAGDIPREQVYAQGDVVKPEFAIGRINDMAMKLDQFKPGLGDVFKAKVSPENVTMTGNVPESLLSTAEQVLKDASKSPVGSAVEGVTSGIRKIGSDVGDTMSNIKAPEFGAAGKYLKGAASDIIPTRQAMINHNIAKALDLTPSDLSNIEASTGNSVGQFLADNNLIGSNKATTQGMINKFYAENYAAVRSAINQVKNTYNIAKVPNYFDALKQLKSTVEGVPGLEKKAVEVENLMNKKEVTLADVQRVKELMDDNFNLYKVTGDVAQGATKEGLANMRSTLKKFIETEVKKNTGQDIKQMNNNVQTARSLDDAITTRSTRGLTRANITWRDFAIGSGITYFATPLVGAAVVLAKKILTSPTARLRFARYLDGLNDAARAKISEDIKNGKVSPEIEKVVNEPNPLENTVSP